MSREKSHHNMTSAPAFLQIFREFLVLLQGGPLLVVNRVIAPLIGGITPLLTGRGPPCGYRKITTPEN